MGDPLSRAGLAYKSEDTATHFQRLPKPQVTETQHLKATEIHSCSQELQDLPSALALPPSGFQFPSCFLPLSLARKRHSLLLYLPLSRCISCRVCLPGSFKPPLKADSLV